MLLLRVFLLVMLIGDSVSTKILVDDCDEMTCLVVTSCLYAAGDSPMLTMVSKGAEIFDNCDGIVKIRSYSKQLYLIALESNRTGIKSLKLKQGATEFECKRDATNTMGVSANSVGENHELILTEVQRTKARAKLACTFIVRSKSGEVFESAADELMFFYSNDFPWATHAGASFFAYCKPTCDPDSVKPAKLGAVGDKTVSKVDVQLADLVCPAGQKLTFRKDSASNFEEARSINCVKKESGYEFEPKLIEAQCEIITCTQCNSTMAPPFPNLETFTDGGCTKLRCKNNDRLKIGSSDPVEGSAECKFENNQPVWKFNGETIKADSTVTCQEKKKCFSTMEDVERMCENCELGPDNIPICVGDSATLMYQTKNMTVLCDDVTGKYSYNDGNANYTTFKEKLHCADKKATGGAAAKQEGSTDKTTVAMCIAGLLLVAAIIGSVVGVWLYRKSKKAKKDANKKQEYPVPGGGPSRSGHSRSGHSGTPDRSAQSTANQEETTGRDPKSVKPFERNVLVPGNGSDMTPVSRPDKPADQSQPRKKPKSKKKKTEEEPKLTEEEQAALENADTVFKKDEDSAPENINTARSVKSAVPEAANDRGGDRGGGEGAARPGSARPANELCGTGPPNMPRPKGGRSQLEEMNKMKKKSATPK